MNIFPPSPVSVLGVPCSNILGVMGHVVGGAKSECSDVLSQVLKHSVIHPQEGEETSFGVKDMSLSLKPGEELEANSFSAVGKIRHTKLCARGHWRPAEDDKLKKLVAQFGPQNWNSIADHLPGRSGKSCRLRWFNQLDPRINRKAFSEEEEERLLNAHKVYGNKWAMISRLFHGRTDNAMKNHWHVIMARRKRDKSCIYQRRKPTFQILPSKDLNLTLSKNGSSESAISSTIIDESGSTGTYLSFTLSSAKPTPVPFHNHCPAQNHQVFGVLLGLSRESRTPAKDVGFNKHFRAWNGSCDAGHMGKPVGVDQSHYSDSNSSEVSVSESVATNKITNLSMYGKSENMGNNRTSMFFIDFLGVGAT
ncbi:unnamed protein product [Sphenostylis stenocarpa]|uniref:Uncharacterized protein n=1 Tax=Sphenostylis stenocarpa TaxID=92480 RepID=A0AA86SF50_9FABA|nr:unnamed protein product [Sphenostylis stenocarpa]